MTRKEKINARTRPQPRHRSSTRRLHSLSSLYDGDDGDGGDDGGGGGGGDDDDDDDDERHRLGRPLKFSITLQIGFSRHADGAKQRALAPTRPPPNPQRQSERKWQLAMKKMTVRNVYAQCLRVLESSKKKRRLKLQFFFCSLFFRKLFNERRL